MRDEQHDEQVGDRDQPVEEVEWEGKGDQEIVGVCHRL